MRLVPGSCDRHHCFQQSLGNVSALYTIAALAALVATYGLALLAGTIARTYTSGEVQPTELLVDTSEPADE